VPQSLARGRVVRRGAERTAWRQSAHSGQVSRGGTTVYSIRSSSVPPTKSRRSSAARIGALRSAHAMSRSGRRRAPRDKLS